ncbi:hypothetical protein [Clostridium baratii]|uniref:hypothetical protein n=1 Tax=Clostridium baratii TaxID=1561 RepID=UPI0030D5849D
MASKKDETDYTKKTVETILKAKGVTYEEWLDKKHKEFLGEKENRKKLDEIFGFYIDAM